MRMPGEPRVGAWVRVADHHGVEWRRGKVGRTVERCGGEEYVALLVRFSGGAERMFWSKDLVEVE
jgi:hypothetical protein